MGTRIFIDANVPMYAHGASHPYRQPCRAALRRVVSENIPAVTSSEVVQEILHRYLSLKRHDQAVQVTSDFMTIVPAVLPVTRRDIERALRLIRRYPDLSARDLLHVAVMLNHDITQILSTDTHFDQVDKVERLDPASFSAESEAGTDAPA